MICALLIGFSSNAQGLNPKLLLAKGMGIYKHPRWQTSKAIQNASNTGKAYADAYYAIKSKNDFYFYFVNGFLSFPGVYLFNKDLQPIRQFHGDNCINDATRFVIGLSDSSKTVPDTNMKFTAREVLKHAGYLSGDSAITENGEFQFLYIYVWATYFPKYMSSSFDASRAIHANKNVTFKIISLNADYLASWAEKPEKAAGKRVPVSRILKGTPEKQKGQ